MHHNSQNVNRLRIAIQKIKQLFFTVAFLFLTYILQIKKGWQCRPFNFIFLQLQSVDKNLSGHQKAI